MKFTGGGSQFSFNLDQGDVASLLGTLSGASPIKNSKGFVAIGGSAGINLKGLVSVGAEVSGQAKFTIDQQATQTDENGEETSIGFVLSDLDIGDVFDVEIFIDPDYGTFVYTMNSGRSRCPNELGTELLEVPSLTLKSGPTRAAVLPDEPLIFKLELSNRGSISTTFQLYTDPTDLDVQFVSSYDIEANDNVVATVIINRGVVDFNYNSVKLYMSSTCEFEGSSPNPASTSIQLSNTIDRNRTIETRQRIEFAEPCPGIVWSGKLAYDRSFQVNLADQKNDTAKSFSVVVTVRNPSASYRKLSVIVNDITSRLQAAGLWFRRIGSADWLQAMNSSNLTIDFTSLPEDSFGFISAAWDVTNLGDGHYEIEARTVCDSSFGSVPDEFNVAHTDRITGIIDRKPPKIFGRPYPTPDTLLFPGDDVIFHFNEEIDCTLPHNFLVQARVFGTSRQDFDNSVTGKNNIYTVCEGRSISLQLRRTIFEFEQIEYK